MIPVSKLRVLIACLSMLAPLAAVAGTMSVRAEQTIGDFMTLRMELSTSPTSADALTRISAFERTYQGQAATFSEEERLVIENFIVLEKYNYLRGDPSARNSIRDSLRQQKDRNDAWLAAHKKEAASHWLYCTAADVISCYISFSFADVMRYGLSIRDYYQKALAQNDHCSYVLTNIAQWHYWAPRLNGGSKAKAEQYFEKAVAVAKTPAETYFACIFLSQFVFESGSTERSASLLAIAARQCPQSAYVQLIKSVNAQGLSYFQYSKKNSSMDGQPQD